MTKNEVLTTLNGIFSDVLRRQDIKLDYEMTANDVDDWDSLTNMTIISEVEEQFSIHLKLREIIRMKNVGELCDTILKKVA
jgi:acyl carrier protein